MNVNKLYSEVIAYFEQNMPEAQTELHFDNEFQLLVAVMLSAQCTDKRVNMVTPGLFAQYATPRQLADASVADVFQLIKSVSYPNSKSSHLVAMANMLCDDFGGKIPHSIDDMQKLPGVGRKTANVMSIVAFNQPAMPVDTHVFRVSNRIGLTYRSKTPLETERILVSNIPQDKLHIAHHWLILHGRYVCTARSPKCPLCGLNQICLYDEKSK